MATPELALIPTGYKAGKVYSVLPESGVGDFAFTRASEATRTNSAGLLEVEATGVPRLEYPLIDGVVNGCPSLLLENQATNLITYPISFGNPYWTKSGATIEGDPSTAGSELVVNGDFATDSDWTKGTGWSIGSGVASCDGTQTAGTQLTQNGTYTINKTYKITYTAIVTAGFVTVRLSGVGALVSGISRTTSGTYTEYLTSTGNNLFILRGNTNFIGSVDNVSVKEVQGYSSPSVDFPTSGFKLVEDTSTGQHYTQVGITTTATDFSVSFYVKPAERTGVVVASSYGGVYFDLLNETIISGTGGKIEALTNGWYRCSVTQLATVAIPNYSITLLNDSDANSYTGDGTSGVYIFMAQVEQGSYATSPTLTSLSAEGTTTTRVAETCYGAGNASTFNDSEGVLMVDISAFEETNSFESITINDNSTSNRVFIGYYSDDLYIVIRSGGQSKYDVNTPINVKQNNKIAVKYKLNDFSLYLNGFEINSSAGINGGTTPVGLANLSFDRGDGVEDFYGKTKQIQYFNTVLTDLEIETLTSWTSFTAMANAQQYNII